MPSAVTTAPPTNQAAGGQGQLGCRGLPVRVTVLVAEALIIEVAGRADGRPVAQHADGVHADRSVAEDVEHQRDFRDRQ